MRRIEAGSNWLRSYEPTQKPSTHRLDHASLRQVKAAVPRPGNFFGHRRSGGAHTLRNERYLTRVCPQSPPTAGTGYLPRGLQR